MNYKKQTKVFIAVVLLAVIVFDSYVFIGGGTEATISHAIMTWSYDYPAMTFAVGFLCGHLFWRIRDVKKPSDSKPAG